MRGELGDVLFQVRGHLRSAASAYESRCKSLYAAFYNGRDKVNVFDYLALDVFLGLSKYGVDHLLAYGAFPATPEFRRPFAKLAGWDGVSAITSAQVPDWWKAYNAVKHDSNGVERSATLANATAATAALFLLTERVFGFGILSGGMVDMPSEPPTPGSPFTTSSTDMRTRWSRLFDRTYLKSE